MQTLNVGAGRTDEEYKAADQQRHADLLAESRNAASYFFWAAGLAALGTGLLPVRIYFLVSIGAVDLLSLYGGLFGSLQGIAVFGAAVTWVVVLLALGFAGRHGYRWAFLAGVVMYGADMIALTVLFSLWAFGVHAFFVFKWFQGQRTLKDLQGTDIATS